MPRYLGQGFAEKVGDLAGLSPEDREVVAYGLEYLLSGIIGLALILLAGFVLGFLRETMAILFCWVLMRVFAGGAHCTALWRCTVANVLGILTALLVTGAVALMIPPHFWVSAAAIWALLSIAIWAPNNSERPEHDPHRRRRLRRRALVLVFVLSGGLFYLATNGPGYWPVLAAAGGTGLASGGFMITPAGFRLVSLFDQKLIYIRHSFQKGGEVS